MKVTQRIPTQQFAYIEVEMEAETPEEAFVEHERLLALHAGGVGLNPSDWKRAKLHMMNTGEFDPNLFEEMNKAQRYWVNETKKTLRDIKTD